ncbi:hypothetical protein NKR23_g8372 [Pleurostoma richardsiae]|uniref:Pentatricopeptide repeat domain-containing protein n=1 Tax=Pleurostoma richardsiae TaxID=41990 RepID=A0AA38R989_9PEZI|nr:hypothetical protein NKR23_g8372 [Pleurostoma richardsiae]
MHTLFSRAAKAHVCSCQSCLHTANSVARRTTAAAAGVHRKASVADVFTACYTTILGTAAVLDARRKDERRSDLDRRIETARTSLARLTGESPDQAVPGLRSISLDPDLLLPEKFPGVIRTLSSICRPSKELLAQHRNADARRRELQHLHGAFSQERRLQETLAALKGVNLESVEQSLVSEEDEETFHRHREPMTTMQFTLAVGSINDMVDNLIMEAYRREHPDNPEAVRKSLESLDSAWTAIRMLRSDGYPNYNHPEVDPPSTHKARQHLNQINRSIFKTWREEQRKAGKDDLALRSRAKFLVAKICYNLLISPVPPSIHNFNALLLGFTRVGEHSLAKVVAKTLLKSSRLRPTQQTLVCLLHHYRATNDIRGFYRIIRRLIGLDIRGIHIRRKLVDEVSIYPVLQLWARKADVARRGPYFVQRARRDDALYEAIIKGLLHFDRVVDASKVFVACLAERCSVTASTLIQLLNQCLYTLDQGAARIIVRGLMTNINWTASLLLDDDCPRKLAEDIYPLLGLCAESPYRSLLPSGENDGLDVFRDLRPEVKPSPRSTRNLQRLSAALFVRDTENQLHRLQHVLRRMERRLRDASLPMADTASRAVRELDWLDAHYKSLIRDTANYGRLIRTSSISEEVWRSERDTKRLEFQLANILSSSLPKGSSCRAMLQQHELPIRKRVRAYMAALNHGGIQIKAEQALVVSEGLDNALKYTLLSSLDSEERDFLFAEFGGGISSIPIEAILECRSRHVAAAEAMPDIGDMTASARERWSSRLERAVPDFRASSPGASDLIRPTGSWWAGRKVDYT